MNEFAWVVARRYLTARRKQAFISLISGVSVLGVAVGVAALIIALALMTGLQREMRDRIIASAAHLYIYPTGAQWSDSIEKDSATILATPGVTGVAPAVMGKGLLKAGGGASGFVTIKGIDVKSEPTVTGIVNGMRAGSLDALANRSPDQLDGIILGVDLATSLGAHVGDRLTLITPDGPITPYGQMTGRRNFEVVGTFQMGLYELDSSYALINLPVAIEFLRLQAPSLLQARVNEMFKAPEIGDAVKQRLGAAYSVENWTDMNK
jgi:lipoprotein-releasing system permease protein